MIPCILRWVVPCAITMTLTVPASSQNSPVKLIASDGMASAEFGQQVDIDGNRAIVGAYNHITGQAYVFSFDGSSWTQEAILAPSDGQYGDWFGHDVAICGEWAAVGSVRHGGNRGAVYLYRFDDTTWSEYGKIMASDGLQGDNFGYQLDLFEDVLVVGAPLAGGTGSAYVFEGVGSGAPTEVKLIPNDCAVGDRVGSDVALDGSFAVVGAHLHDGSRGAAYVFHRTGTSWLDNDQTKLAPEELDPSDKFGLNVAVQSDLVVVGAHEDDDVGPDAGAAYVFRYDSTGWLGEAKLFPPMDPWQSDFAGNIGIEGSQVLITAAHGPAGSGDGVVYVFNHAQGLWTLEESIAAPDGEPGDRFGNDFAIDGVHLIVGAPGDDDPVLGGNAGSAYVFTRALDLEQLALDLADMIAGLDLALFNGPNSNANSGRRNSLVNRALEAADAIVEGDYAAAEELLSSLLAKIDDQSPPPDWMYSSPEKAALADAVGGLLGLLVQQ
jgi:hypothetical protein